MPDLHLNVQLRDVVIREAGRLLALRFTESV